MAAAVPLELRLALREGSIFYFVERSLTSQEPHYQIVVNANPLRDELLLLTVCTSKVEKVKFRRAGTLETVVELHPAQLPKVLKKGSIVDCNLLVRVPLPEFCERWKRGEIKSFDQDLPETLRQAIRHAIHASLMVTGEYKALVAAP